MTTAPRRTGEWMQTYTGRQFWPLSPRPEDVTIKDIAHALSNLCRYGGHARKFYSVAEHSVLMAEALHLDGHPAEVCRAALLHDATEAYLVDVPRPVKASLGGYKATEDKLLRVLAKRFSFPYPLPLSVTEADNAILVDEKDALMSDTLHWAGIPEDGLGVQIYGWRPEDAEQRFLRAFLEFN